MSQYQKWSEITPAASDPIPLRCVLMVSRNKDNRDVDGFHERRISFVHEVPELSGAASLLADRFSDFVSHGVPGETCRLYVSVNRRDNAMVRKFLLERLIFDEHVSMARLSSVICGMAARKECAAEGRWMFDVDIPHAEGTRALEFVSDLESVSGLESEICVTPNGYAVIVDHGFDVRPLMDRWSHDVTLKRDDLLCVDWKQSQPSVLAGFNQVPWMTGVDHL